MRHCLIAIAAVAASALLPANARGNDVIYGPRDAASAVLVLHWGGYVGGTPALTARPARYFARRGLRVVNADYPLGDLDAASRYALREAARLRRTHREVYAYGESAGGGIAAMLAARGAVDAAVADSPVADPVDYAGVAWAPRPARIRASAMSYLGPHSSPLWLIHAVGDPIVPVTQTIELAEQYGPRARLTILTGHRHIYQVNTAWGSARRYYRSVTRYFKRAAR